jgi:predicted phosphodiesterase
MNEKILIVGDNHLSSSNRSNHADYSDEAYQCLLNIVEIAEEQDIDLYIDLGDISYGKFNLDYRAKVEALYERLNKVTHGKCLSVRGNHDMSLKNISEWEYYTLHRKMFNNLDNFTDGLIEVSRVEDGYMTVDLDLCRLHLIDYKHEDVDLHIADGKSNYVCMHNYVKFKDTAMPNFGTAIELDFKEGWYGVDAIFCGHVHRHKLFKGEMFKDGHGKNVNVIYPGAIVRTNYEDDMDEEGHIVLLDNTNEQEMTDISIPWIPEEDAFLIADIIKEQKKVDVSDIVKNLNDKERTIGNPIEAIQNMADYKQEYKDKAIALLQGL